jgi:RimJ/RimL family protein N-acetyltransferase
LLEGNRVHLRSFELSDLDEIMKYWNRMELRRLLGNVDKGPVARNQEEEWIKDTWNLRKERKAFLFAIENLADAKLIGGTGLFDIDWTSRSAEVVIIIYNPEYWGKDYGAESLDLILEFAFRDLNMNRVELHVLEFNERAYKCYLKVGFKEIGRKRKAKFIEGNYHDRIMMDILREEWSTKGETQ